MTTVLAPASMTERDWQRLVITTARYRGWEAHHHHDSRRSEPGWPDLVLIGHRRALFVELKTNTGRLAPVQIEWLTALHTAGCEVAVWRPRDLPAVLSVLGPTQQRLHGDGLP